MKVEDILLQAVGHLFNLDELVAIVLVEYTFDTDCVGTSPAEVLNLLVWVPSTRYRPCSQFVVIRRDWLCSRLWTWLKVDLLSFHLIVCLDQAQELLILVELVWISVCDRCPTRRIWTDQRLSIGLMCNYRLDQVRYAKGTDCVSAVW